MRFVVVVARRLAAAALIVIMVSSAAAAGPRARLVGRYHASLRTGAFDALLALNDELFADAPATGHDSPSQLAADARALTALQEANDLVFLVGATPSMAPHLLLDARAALMAAARGLRPAEGLVAKGALLSRLRRYQGELADGLLRLLDGAAREATAACGRGDPETARAGLLAADALATEAGDLLPPPVLARARALLERLFRTLISPWTRERSLPFSLALDHLASASAGLGYLMGAKLSDRDFARLLAGGAPSLRTDCSGFLGRVYRELARRAGLPLAAFPVPDDGSVCSTDLIDGRSACRVLLADGADALAPLWQGDVIYLELVIRGERQRHVVMFDRLVHQEGREPRVATWEASPRGVRRRVRSARRILAWLRDPAGKPRAGVYRLHEMGAIDGLLAATGQDRLASLAD